MTTDTSERGLERLICRALTGSPCLSAEASAKSGERAPTGDADAGERPTADGAGWLCGRPDDYDREYCVDLGAAARLPARDAAGGVRERSTSTRTARRAASSWPGSRARSASAASSTCCATASSTGRITSTCSTARPRPATPRPPSATPPTASASRASSATAATRRSCALDLGLFINGLPVATFELKNSLTKQTVEDAVEQYQRDRDPRERLFEFGRCVVHFAVDDHEVRFCTHLKGKASWFLPFNKGWNDGAGNPPNPDGLKTDYLWKRILTRDGLTDILENYAQIVETKDDEDRQEEGEADLPALPPARRGAPAAGRRAGARRGQRYLIQHSAGSGKSNSIAWLAHQLIGLHEGRRRRSSTRSSSSPTGASSTSRSATRSSSSRRWAPRSATPSIRATCARSSPRGKKIIISTVQKFPFILDEIGERAPRAALRHHHRRGALQPGRADLGGDVSMALSSAGAEEDDETLEDTINRHHGGAKDAAQRELLRLHRHAEEQDAGDLRRARAADGRARSSTGPSTATR